MSYTCGRLHMVASKHELCLKVKGHCLCYLGTCGIIEKAVSALPVNEILKVRCADCTSREDHVGDRRKGRELIESPLLTRKPIITTAQLEKHMETLTEIWGDEEHCPFHPIHVHDHTNQEEFDSVYIAGLKPSLMPKTTDNGKHSGSGLKPVLGPSGSRWAKDNDKSKHSASDKVSDPVATPSRLIKAHEPDPDMATETTRMPAEQAFATVKKPNTGNTHKESIESVASLHHIQPDRGSISFVMNISPVCEARVPVTDPKVAQKQKEGLIEHETHSNSTQHELSKMPTEQKLSVGTHVPPHLQHLQTKADTVGDETTAKVIGSNIGISTKKILDKSQRIEQEQNTTVREAQQETLLDDLNAQPLARAWVPPHIRHQKNTPGSDDSGDRWEFIDHSGGIPAKPTTMTSPPVAASSTDQTVNTVHRKALPELRGAKDFLARKGI